MIYVILIVSIIISYTIDKKFNELEEKIEKLEWYFDDKYDDLDYQISDLKMEMRRNSNEE